MTNTNEVGKFEAMADSDTPDIEFTREGFLIIITPVTDAGREWIDNNVAAEEWQKMGSSIVSEMGYAYDIAQGASRDGLTVA